MERVLQMTIKTVKFDLKTNKMLVFVDDGSVVRKIEISTKNKLNSGVPSKGWDSLAKEEAMHEKQQSLLASRGMLIPGYNS